MASITTEKASELFARFKKQHTFLLEKKILPPLSFQDVVQISGGPGSGKTELLYHFIIRCILPESPWHGLNMKVIFIDTDCHFNLLRFMQTFEKKMRGTMNKEDISPFIHSNLKQLEIVKCTDYDELVGTLRYLELLRTPKFILMIDGVTSFYWSSKMRTLFSQPKVLDHQTILSSIISAISKNGVPVVLTRRVLGPSFDHTGLDSLWQKTSTCFLELENKGSAQSTTKIIVTNVIARHKVECTISDSGLTFHS